MSRRFVNMIIGNYSGGRHVYSHSLHRINPWRCFYPTRAQALEAANKMTTMEDARLPRSTISFYHPNGIISLMSLGDDIISTDRDGNTLCYHADSRALCAVPAPHAPKCSPISIPVGGSLYVLNRYPSSQEDHAFEVLTPPPRRSEEGWCWRSLPTPQPPFSFDYGIDYDLGDRVEEEEEEEDYDVGHPASYEIQAYSVVGNSQIWVTTKSGGTFAYDTTSSVWSIPGEWALPFWGSVHYAPELGLWFGFSSETNQFAASDLSAASATRPPVLHKVMWDELLPPLQDRWVLTNLYLLPLGAGKFCIARVFDMADEGFRFRRYKDCCNYDCVECFVVFTGVEVERGSNGQLDMIRHKSIRYSAGHKPIKYLL